MLTLCGWNKEHWTCFGCNKLMSEIKSNEKQKYTNIMHTEQACNHLCLFMYLGCIGIVLVAFATVTFSIFGTHKFEEKKRNSNFLISK